MFFSCICLSQTRKTEYRLSIGNLIFDQQQVRTVVIGEEGTTEVDLDEGAEKRFYRVRD